MPKPRAVVRQWTLLRILAQQKDGMSIAEMAKQMAVNERTIRRDINLFVQAGVPLREAVGRRGKKAWRVDDRANVAIPDCSLDEALALAVVERLLAPLHGTRLYCAAKRCRERVTASLSAPERSQLESQIRKLSSEWEGAYSLPPGLASLDSLLLAFDARQ